MTRWLERRRQIEIPSSLIKTRPVRELVRNLYQRLGIYGHQVAEDAFFSTEQVYYDLDRHIATQLHKFSDLQAVYAYDDGALAQFQQAGKLGLGRIYDLPIGYWRELRAITLDESEAQPEWRSTMKALTDTNAKNQRKEAELELADIIFCASSYTKKTLSAVSQRNDAVVIPYGMPEVTAPPRTETDPASPLRVLFVGGLTQRKGISYLFHAVQMMGNAVKLTVIGTKGGHARSLDEACARHRWLETLPHAEILAEMRQHDVLVFPSLFEGFGLVIGEALSQGMPVITTNHTGGPDIMQDGVEGFLVPIRSAAAIAEKLQLLHDDRSLLCQMSHAARNRALQSSWKRYETHVAQEALKFLQSRSAADLFQVADLAQ